MKLIYRILLAIEAGILLALTLPSVNIKLIAWIALIPLLIAIYDVKWHKAFLLGMLSGVIYFSAAGYWIFIFTKIGFIISILVTSSFLGLFCALVRLLQARSLWWKIFLPPLIWISLAYIFSFTPTESFWAHFGQPQPLYLLQIISITGLAGLTFLIVSLNSIISSFIINAEKKRIPIAAGTIIAVIVLIIAVYGAINVQEDVTGEISVAVVQPNFPDSMEWRKEHADEIFDTYEKLILDAGEADIIVLPLYTLPVEFNAFLRKFENFSRMSNAYIAVGNYRGNTNVALLFSNEGKLIGEYEAIHKPPFRNQTAGNEYVVMNTGLGRLGLLSCYDTVGEKITREFARKDSQLLVSMANDNRFFGTTELQQHFEIDILRAVQSKRYIVRAVPSGISSIINPFGSVLERSEIGKQQILFGKVKAIGEQTMFTRFGDILSPFSLLVIIAYIIREKIPFAEKK